ncbi:MAG TPA: hypothetical protein VEK07_02270 [Polyangiaceae bacterium]|nr:hypothetical protein [Polyangiaceae bacterium]
MTIPVQRRVVAALAWLGLVTHARAAAPQIEPSVDLRSWRPSTDPEANLTLEPTESACRFCWNAGAWLAYAQDPVTIRNGSAVAWRPVAHQLAGDLTGGIGLGARTAIGVDVPLVLWQEGSPRPSISGTGALPASASSNALGDVSLQGKVTMVSNDRQGTPLGLGLAAVGTVSLPTGNKSSYAAEGAVTASLRILGEYALGAAALGLQLGFAFRPDWRTWTPDVSSAPVTLGDSVLWAAGVTIRPKAIVPALDGSDRQRWELAAHGALPAGPVAPFGLGRPGASAQSPALVGLDDRVSLDDRRDFYLIAGLEAGVDTAAGVPRLRGVLSFGWAPRTHDRDGDGVPDDVDQCPDLPEDKDGIQDQDGCPEDDADGDGIPDGEDACALAAGPPASDPRRNGCPAPTRAPAQTPAAPPAPAPAQTPTEKHP